MLHEFMENRVYIRELFSSSFICNVFFFLLFAGVKFYREKAFASELHEFKLCLSFVNEKIQLRWKIFGFLINDILVKLMRDIRTQVNLATLQVVNVCHQLTIESTAIVQ